jgi:hypothetical protein
MDEIVSGIFYTSPNTSHPIPVPAHYTVNGTNSTSTDPFVLELSTPNTLDELTIDNTNLSRATQNTKPNLELLQTEQNLVVRANHDLVLT